MKKLIMIIALAAALPSLVSCSGGGDGSDAYGNFESVATVISAETSGRLVRFTVDEGDLLNRGDTVAVVDTTSLAIQRREYTAGLAATADEIESLEAELAARKARMKNLERDKERTEKMYREDAATERELDQVTTELDAAKSGIEALKAKKSALSNKRKSALAGIEMVEYRISRSVIENPLDGTVLESYREESELVMPGTPLYKIEDLTEMDLRVYVSGAQLPHIKIGQQVDVLIDQDRKKERKLEGRVIWISDQAEFTPKTIQTKEERVDLVYAVRVRVSNDGSIKAGMPAEVRFTGSSEGGKN